MKKITFSPNLLRIILLVVNIIFVIVAVVFVIVCFKTKSTLSPIEKKLGKSSFMDMLPIVALVLVSLMCVIAILGFLGLFKRIIIVLIIFAALLLVFFLIQLGVGGFMLTQIHLKSKFGKEMKNKTDGVVEYYYESKKAKDMGDWMHKQLQCCGSDGPLDYTAPPETCTDPLTKMPYSTGCFEKLFSILEGCISSIGNTLVALAFIELIDAICAIILIILLKRRRRSGRGGGDDQSQ